MRPLPASILLALLAACSGKVSYTPPAAPAPVRNSVVVAAPFDSVWRPLVASLGREFFVINNVDRNSGLINISYAGDPLEYVDCGQFTSTVTNARGTRSYQFPFASPHERYEVLEPKPGGRLLSIERWMDLEGRANIIVEPASATETRVSVHVRYLLQRRTHVAGYAPSQDQIVFQTGGTGDLGSGGGEQRVCHPTGRLETLILDRATALAPSR